MPRVCAIFIAREVISFIFPVLNKKVLFVTIHQVNNLIIKYKTVTYAIIFSQTDNATCIKSPKNINTYLTLLIRPTIIQQVKMTYEYLYDNK